MKFKQYLYEGIGDRMISASKSTSVGDVLDLVCEGVRIDDLKLMSVNFERDAEVGTNTDDLPVFVPDGTEESVLMEEDFRQIQRYVFAARGLFPNCRVAEIKFRQKYIRIEAVVFDQDGSFKTSMAAHLAHLPQNMKMIVETEVASDVSSPDTYVIRNTAAQGEDMQIVIEEYRGAEIIRICELGEDERGKFELITEP